MTINLLDKLINNKYGRRLIRFTQKKDRLFLATNLDFIDKLAENENTSFLKYSNSQVMDLKMGRRQRQRF